MKGTLAERFWAKVDKRGPGECWPWLATTCEGGYGRIWDVDMTRPSHQVAWELANDRPFPAGLEGCHSCDHPWCCNPAHVFPGTHADNMHDMMSKGRAVYLSGEHHGRSKMTEDDALDIRAARAFGATFESIGKAYGITKTNARRIVVGIHWKHIPEGVTT